MEKLLFVYNAFSGTHNTVLDALHKMVNPKSYPCTLCRITYGVFSEDPGWKKFRKNAKVEMEFLHMDEFQKTYASKFGYKYTFPIVLWEDKGELGIFIATKEIERLQNAETLIKTIQERL